MEKKNNSWILPTVLLVIVLVILFFVYNKTEDLENENVQLDKKIKTYILTKDSLKSELKKKQPALDSLEKELDSVKLAKSDNQLKKEYHEKIIAVNKHTVSDMQSHFDSLANDWISKNRTQKASNP